MKFNLIKTQRGEDVNLNWGGQVCIIPVWSLEWLVQSLYHCHQHRQWPGK